METLIGFCRKDKQDKLVVENSNTGNKQASDFADPRLAIKAIEMEL